AQQRERTGYSSFCGYPCRSGSVGNGDRTVSAALPLASATLNERLVSPKPTRCVGLSPRPLTHGTLAQCRGALRAVLTIVVAHRRKNDLLGVFATVYLVDEHLRLGTRNKFVRRKVVR